jgi:uncharacterized protein (UPF0218 family)
MLRLPPVHRDVFRAPFGTLYPHLNDAIPILSGRCVYAVGDVVTCNLVTAGITPDVAIIDGYSMRIRCTRTPILLSRRIRVKNPPGTLTEELLGAIEDAIANPPALIIVEGEEDLAVIPVVLAAPEGAVVLYGQPNEGVVVRIVDEGARKRAREMIALFEEDSGSLSTGAL